MFSSLGNLKCAYQLATLLTALVVAESIRIHLGDSLGLFASQTMMAVVSPDTPCIRLSFGGLPAWLSIDSLAYAAEGINALSPIEGSASLVWG